MVEQFEGEVTGRKFVKGIVGDPRFLAPAVALSKERMVWFTPTYCRPFVHQCVRGERWQGRRVNGGTLLASFFLSLPIFFISFLAIHYEAKYWWQMHIPHGPTVHHFH